MQRLGIGHTRSMTRVEGEQGEMARAAADRDRFAGVRDDLWVVAALLAAVLFSRLVWFGYPIADYDEQLYSLVGNAMTHGAFPFVDLWDRKPFGLFALFAAAHAIGGPGPVAYQVLAALFTLAGGWLTYRLALPLVDRVTAGGAGVLYVLLMSTYGSQSGQSEAFFVPLLLAMAALVADPAHRDAMRRAMIAMVVGGVALQVKYTALPQCILLGLWVLWWRHRLGDGFARLARLAIVFAALGLLPTIVIGTGYAVAGYWDEFFFANFVSFFDRAASGGGRIHRDLVLFLMPLILLAVGGLYAALRLTRPRNGKHYVFILVLFVGCLATIFLPSTVYAYYFAAAVPSTILVALPLLDRTGPARWVPLALLVAGAAYIQFIPETFEDSRKRHAQFDSFAAAIAPHVDGRAECMWIHDGPTALYTATGSCLPSRFVYPDHLNNLLERDALGISQAEEVRRILAARPPVIVTADSPLTPQSPDVLEMVRTALGEDYRPLARTQVGERTIRAWLREDLSVGRDAD